MTQYEENVIAYALQAYGFLMPFKKPFTLAELAEKIKQHYSMDEQHNREVVRILEKVTEEVYS